MLTLTNSLRMPELFSKSAGFFLISSLTKLSGPFSVFVDRSFVTCTPKARSCFGGISIGRLTQGQRCATCTARQCVLKKLIVLIQHIALMLGCGLQGTIEDNLDIHFTGMLDPTYGSRMAKTVAPGYNMSPSLL